MASKAKDLTSKLRIVDEIKGLLEQSPTVAIIHFNKLSANDMNELRTNLLNANSFVKIFKNTLILIALQEKYPSLGKGLQLNNAVVFANDDGLAALKVLKEFKEEKKNIEIIKGAFDFKVTTKEDLLTLASLSNKEGMLSMLLSALQGQVKMLLWGLKEVATKKENN